MSDDHGSVRMEANLFQALLNEDVSCQVAVEDRGEGRLGVTVSLPLPDQVDEWVSVRLDLTSTVGLTVWLGHAVRLAEATASEEEREVANAMLEDLQKKSAHPQNRQQRRAAERRGQR